SNGSIVSSTGGSVTIAASMPEAAGNAATIEAKAIGVTFALAVGTSSSAATVSIGVAVAKNDIGGGRGNVARANIDGGTVTAAHDVFVLSDASARIDAIAVGASVGVTVPKNI